MPPARVQFCFELFEIEIQVRKVCSRMRFAGFAQLLPVGHLTDDMARLLWMTSVA